MSRLALPLVLLLAAGAALLGWRHMTALDARIGDLVTEVASLRTDVEMAHTRANAAEARADRAEQRADEADRKALDAEGRVLASQTEAGNAASQAEAEAAARERAEQDRRDALEIARIRDSEAKLAELERVDALKEAERLKAERERDLGRLQRALERIAETRRTALGLVMRLGEESIEFDFDKAELRPQNREMLARIAGVLSTAEDYQIQVFGHTDDVGTVEYNQGLSERRAQVVADYLRTAGIDPAILSTKGFGKTSPLVEGTDPVSRQRNRRVEIAITQTSGELAAVVPPSGG